MDGLTELPFGLPGKIFRSPLPFSPMFDPRGRVLPAYEAAGVDMVVMLNTHAELRRLLDFDLASRYQQAGYAVVHAPVPDFQAPPIEVFRPALARVLEAAREGQTIAIHCHAGVGRTGSFAACLAKMLFGLTGDEAVAWVRQFIPDAVENAEQYQFVLDFDGAVG